MKETANSAAPVAGSRKPPNFCAAPIASTTSRENVQSWAWSQKFDQYDLAVPELTRSAGISLTSEVRCGVTRLRYQWCTGQIPRRPGTTPGKAVRRSYSAWRLLLWDGPNQHGSSELWFFRPIGIIWTPMSSAKRDEAPRTNLDTAGRAGKLKVACLLAGFAIVVLIAMAAWLYFLASLILGLAIWIFS
jgi:hypothetical protein